MTKFLKLREGGRSRKSTESKFDPHAPGMGIKKIEFFGNFDLVHFPYYLMSFIKIKYYTLSPKDGSAKYILL